MCSTGVWKKQQRLLKNMGAHKVMLDLLQVSYDQVRPDFENKVEEKIWCYVRSSAAPVGHFNVVCLQNDVKMQEIIRYTHLFLQKFCMGNQENQALLHKNLNLFLNPGVTSFYIQYICVYFYRTLNEHKI